MTRSEKRLAKLEQGLLDALRAIDNQVAREMQRTPEQRQQHGVHKAQPYRTRVESVCGFVVEQLAARECDLDSVLVMSQALVKALGLFVGELGSSGLGAVRSSYCREALDAMQRDLRGATSHIAADQPQ